METAGDTMRSYANSVFDYNNDGLIDLVNNPLGGDVKIAVWKNESSNDNNHLKIILEGSISNRNGVGSWIEVYTDDITQYRFTHCGISFLSQQSYNNHFGLSNFNKVDSIIVRWPSGLIDKRYNIDAGQIIKIVEDCPNCPNCESATTDVNQNPIPPGNYHQNELLSTGTVETNSAVLFRVNQSAELGVGFTVQEASHLIVELRDCEEE